MSTLATSGYDIVLAIHIMAVVVGFGATFTYPVMFAVGARHGARSLPLLHRIEYTIERYVVNPGLLMIVVAGIYLASEGKHWSEFFVQWGLGAALVLGALVGAVMMPTAKRAEAVADRDVKASGHGDPELSEEYRGLVKRLSTVGSAMSALVLVTILFMAIKP